MIGKRGFQIKNEVINMGSYMIFDVEFESKKDRLNFEKYFRRKRHNCRALTPYHLKERSPFDKALLMQCVVYYVGFMGYAEPQEILKDCLKDGIKIKFMAWLPISDSGTRWEKIRGRWQ